MNVVRLRIETDGTREGTKAWIEGRENERVGCSVRINGAKEDEATAMIVAAVVPPEAVRGAKAQPIDEGEQRDGRERRSGFGRRATDLRLLPGGKTESEANEGREEGVYPCREK